MNTVNLTGRGTKKPEIKNSGQKNAVARFTLAVDRMFKREGEPTADFISCVAFGKTAEFIERYFQQGMKVGITGRLQTGSYTKQDGTKVYTTDVVVENAEIEESKATTAARNGQAQPAPAAPTGYMPQAAPNYQQAPMQPPQGYQQPMQQQAYAQPQTQPMPQGYQQPQAQPMPPMQQMPANSNGFV